MSLQTNKESNRGWTLAIVSIGLFMVVLDNLVVSVALPSIHRTLGASIQALEWTVNAYVLSYAVLLLTGAALGDRFGRKRMFIAGIALFTLSSAAAALSPTTGMLIAARAIQGIGAAIATPLTMTLLADAFPPTQRGMAIGIWSAISGVAVALGPLVGGAVIQLSSWHWIFWINVPIGAALVPLAAAVRLLESRGEVRRLDLRGLVLGSGGLFGIVYGLVRSQSIGWTSPQVVIALGTGAVLIAMFIAYELRTEQPMLPMRFFANRSFAVTNAVSLAMYFGMFGSIFFLSQFLQNVLHNTPLQAGVKLLVWTGATMVVSPLAGYFSERYGSRLFMVAGLSLQAIALGWLALTSVDLSYASMIAPFVLAGSGMALVFAPSANAVLSSVRTHETGQASGATNAIRELGGVLGIAVLATVFTSHGSYASAQAYVSGLAPAMWVGVAVLAAGALIATVLPFSTKATAEANAAAESRTAVEFAGAAA